MALNIQLSFFMWMLFSHKAAIQTLCSAYLLTLWTITFSSPALHYHHWRTCRRYQRISPAASWLPLPAYILCPVIVSLIMCTSELHNQKGFKNFLLITIKNNRFLSSIAVLCVYNILLWVYNILEVFCESVAIMNTSLVFRLNAEIRHQVGPAIM